MCRIYENKETSLTVARPKLQIDPLKVENYAALGFTVEEIALLCKCSKDTLERRYAADIKMGRLQDKVSFLRRVRNEAMGDPTKAIDPETGNVIMLPKRRPNLGFCVLYSKLKGWYVEKVESVAEVTSHEKVFIAEWGGKQEAPDSDDKDK